MPPVLLMRARIYYGAPLLRNQVRSQHGMQAGVSDVSSVCNQPVGWPLSSLLALVLTIRMLFVIVQRFGM